MVLSAGMDELNFLAARLEKLDATELTELNAALTSPQSDFHNIGQIIDYPENVDFYVHLPDVTGTGQLGDYYLNRSGMVDMPEEWKAGIFLPRFGLHIANTEHGVFTDYGYLVKSGDEWQRVHEGQPVPEEYRVMAYPAPEILREESKVQPEAAAPTKAPQPVTPILLNGQNSAERMKEITDRLETGTQELFESERYKAYLTTMSKFHSYSFNNTLLIAMQGGQLVAGYRSYEDLQADGLSVDRKNYQLVYTAPLDKDTTLDEIYRRFNIEHPADYKGHSLSTGDIVVFRQDGKQTAYYVDEGADYRQVPEFFAQPEKQLTPDECMTGEQIQTPRGRFYLTDRSREQMEAAGYGFHHQSEDGRYLIMANGTRAFAIPAQQESHIKTAEMSTEQNYNMIDGMMNNAPSMEELEERAKAGEQISLLDVAEAAKAEAKKPKQTRKTTQKQKKPSIRAQLAAAKEEQKKKPPAREKSKEMEV